MLAVELIAAVALVAANAAFVATEFALARLRPTQVEELVAERRPGARAVQHAVEHVDAYLAACQLGITLASLGLGVVGERAFRQLLEPVLGDTAVIGSVALAGALAFLIITLLHIVVGELAPKSVAISVTVRTALLLAPFMRVFYAITRPLVDLVNGLGNLLLRPFGILPASEVGHSPHSERELRQLLRQSSEQGLIEHEERALSERALIFGDRRAREIMTPRPEIVFVTLDDTLQEAAVRAAHNHSRLPLCEPSGGLDAPIGMIHARDLLAVFADRREVHSLAELAHPITRVPESMRIDELLRELRHERRHLALVDDEHGTVVGLVTIEDVLEELVGEIEDEFDIEAEQEFERSRDGTVHVEGGASLRAVAERLGLPLDEVHEATIGGFLLEQLGRLPDVGEMVEVDSITFVVEDVDESRIMRLQVLGQLPAPRREEDGAQDEGAQEQGAQDEGAQER